MIPEDILNQEAKNELNKTVEIETEKIYKKQKKLQRERKSNLQSK